MPYSEKHYRWTWHFRAPPAALWPLVSDTERFNRDCGFPPFQVRASGRGDGPAEPGLRRLRSTYLGIVGEWEEREFEWVQPVRFAVSRKFTKGPILSMVLACELGARADGGTTLVYEIRIAPKNLLGAVIVPLAIGIKMRRDCERVMRSYDERALKAGPSPEALPVPATIPRPGSRLETISSVLIGEAGQPAPLVGLLCSYVAAADDLSASKMRPYALADTWGTPRRETLDLFLHATRAGMLDFSWEVLCPHCRGSKPGKSDLSGVSGEEHCDSCGIDFKVNFDQSIELTFVPNPAIRRVEKLEYCMGGPQITPHIVAQGPIGPGENLHVAMAFPEGRYRVRAQGIAVQQAFRIYPGADAAVRIDLGPGAVPLDEPVVAPNGILNVVNADSVAHVAVIERVAWSDQSVTAAAVTSRQIFRDLFSRELLRQGEQVSVGVITIVFTDLKNSTQLYRDIGDAPAFGRVLNHFDVLKAAIAEEDGAVVKTMGDAVMATFTQPAAALRAMRKAQAALQAPDKAGSSFRLKCSIHQGPCLAINQNERLDYFGTTVNVGARLCSLSTGADIVVSSGIANDPGVVTLLGRPRSPASARHDAAELRGIGGDAFEFWRITG